MVKKGHYDIGNVHQCAKDVIKLEFYSLVHFLKLSYYVNGFTCDDRFERETNMFQREALNTLLEGGYVKVDQSLNLNNYQITPKGIRLLELVAPYFIDVLTERSSEFEETLEIRDDFSSKDQIMRYGGEIIERQLLAHVNALRNADRKIRSGLRMRGIRDLFERIAIINLIKDGFIDIQEKNGDFLYTLTPAGKDLLSIVDPSFP